MRYEVKQAPQTQAVAALPREERRPFVKRMGFLSSRPADKHKDALICGNGRMQMLIYGRPECETAVCSEETLYTPRWAEAPQPPRIAKALPEVRRMLREGDYWSVPDYVIEQVVKDPVYDKRMPFSPNGKTRYSIKPPGKHIAFIMQLSGLTAKKAAGISGYLRTMDFEKGEAYTRFKEGEDATGLEEETLQERRSFVSRADHAAVLEYQFPEARKELRLKLMHEKLKGLHEWDGLGFVPDLEQSVTYDGELAWFIGRYPGDNGHPGAGFIAGFRFITDGEVSLEDGDALANMEGAEAARIMSAEPSEQKTRNPEIVIRGARRLLMLCTIRRFEPLTKELIDGIREQLKNLPADYEVLMERQLTVHGELMRRVELNLAEEDELTLSVEELLEVQHCRKGVSRALLEKMYHMGRYFLITDTGTLPPARGQYNINVNLQVCSGNLGALPEMMRVFFEFFESKFPDFRVNAQNIFGCRGIMASIHPDMESGYQYHFSGPWPHEYWISCAGWVFHEFWDYYLTTGDKEFLKDHIYPGLKEIALFYEDYLTDKDEEGRYLFYPCFSPENGQDKGYPITVNAVMDITVCCEVLEHAIRACEILGITEEEADKVATWNEMLEHMPILLLDEEGGLKEWARADIPENYEHRHVSHHYGTWPAAQILWEKSPELARATLISNRTRGQQNDSAHGIMHRMFTAIRLKDAEGAEGYVKQIMERGFTNYSLMTNHFPHKAYYPDAIGGMPAAVTECLVYSEEGRIEFLPAVFEALKQGCFGGAKLFTYMTLDKLVWDEEDGYLRAEMTSMLDQTVEIGIRRTIREVRRNGVAVTAPNGTMNVALREGERVTVEYYF
ncbi:MAG: glycoside hydrolase N-terminal domain-containing protein [Lachnospiraceae bacterium]|nr:glycoside hydrolase N-terminal domain-containing protein [Lachnospiraceae bacterium]